MTAGTRRNPVVRRWSLLAQFAQLPGIARLLLLTQLAFNVGFYLVVPFLAVHLSKDLAMAGWAIGVVLGVRTFSQQGLFVLGGALTDRFGIRPTVLTGCVLRIVGFVVLAAAEDLGTVLTGTVLIGFAAALFSPAVESALAAQGAALEDRGIITRTELFGLFAVCGEIGAVTGPLLGTALLGVDFGLTCSAAAAVFALILAAHARWLPRGARDERRPLQAGWSDIARNRTFLLFAAAYSAYLLSYNQLYLALPVELERVGAESALGWMFALAAVMVVTGQIPLARWARTRLGATRALPLGFGLLSLAFAVVAAWAPWTPPPGPFGLAPAVAFVVLLTLGQMLAVPVAQDLVPRLAREDNLGSYYGFLSSAGGLAVLVGSGAAGGLLDLAAQPAAAAAVPWLFLAALPAVGGLTLLVLARHYPNENRSH
ncbi:nitrate/nitrite transporter NarK [Saccharopolyspora erythraea NRRL 2338]|uniref:MFS transporter n=1 Tax=Saccharopolyspora erythraea TaxID=1836 RepID=A0ABP3NJQ5_SACER|nr:MFS transporter [Saccharopolyspora erythraea]EQD83339.1 membrane protein [Saccharopolyspora erythraea D]PFG95700.1 nitrate/nitrite transporter NarK [Saccharopolyspora erythraea NRRL 2338]